MLEARMPGTKLVAAVVAAAASLAMAASASAATITVDSGADDNGTGCTLREALDNANTDTDGGPNGCASGSGDDTIAFAGPVIGTIPLDSAKGNLTAGATIGTG